MALGIAAALVLASVAADAPERLSPAELAQWIDVRLGELRKERGRPVRPRADDGVFLRRAYLDLAGTIPSVAEAREFLDYPRAEKRGGKIAELLRTKRSAEHFARQWARTLAPQGDARAGLEAWLAEQFEKRAPFDQTVRAVLTATGDTAKGPSAFYAAVGGAPDKAAEAVARGFLGVRLGCAQCHDHPMSDWKQDHFWGLAAYFGGIAPGRAGEPATLVISPPEGKKEYPARTLDGGAPKDAGGARAELAAWLTAPANKYFAANVVNRVWQDLLGAGLTAKVDDLDLATPQERAAILDELAAKFVASGHDLRWLAEGICRSAAYESASAGAAVAAGERPVRTLSPEQARAAFEQALSLKLGRANNAGAMTAAVYRLLSESRPAAPADFRGGIPQALALMNGELVAAATDLDASMTLRAVLDAPFLKTSEQKLDALYLAAFSRRPRPEERTPLLKLVAAGKDAAARRQAYADVFWAMLNSPEFVLCP